MTAISNKQLTYWIQEAAPEQTPEITRVVNEAFKRTGEYFRQKSTDRVQPQDVYQKLQDRENYRFFVALAKEAEGDTKVVGAGYLYIPGVRGNVYMICTATGYERKGIGSAILKRIEVCAKQIGLKKTILDINNDTRERGLQQFYITNGYRFLRTDFSHSPEKYLFEGGEKLIEDSREGNKHTIPLLFYDKTL